MSSKKLLYPKGNNDECYTPEYAIEPIIKYINLFMEQNKKKHLTIWCPFDTTESFFVKKFSQLNYITCIHSHIKDGQDFFIYEPQKWDIIISNPPFTNKRKFFERALSFKKPFALIMANTWLNDKYSKFVFKEANREMQLLFFDKRIHFIQNKTVSKNTTFSSSYFCCDFLPKQIIIEEISYK